MCGDFILLASVLLSVFVFFHPQPILKGLPGDADHVADADRLERSGVCEFIGRSAANTENGCDVIHCVCSALGRPFFVGAHKTISLAHTIFEVSLSLAGGAKSNRCKPFFRWLTAVFLSAFAAVGAIICRAFSSKRRAQKEGRARRSKGSSRPG